MIYDKLFYAVIIAFAAFVTVIAIIAMLGQFFGFWRERVG